MSKCRQPARVFSVKVVSNINLSASSLYTDISGQKVVHPFFASCRPKVIFLILFFFFFSFTKTVAVSLNEAGPFAFRNSIMGDRGSGVGGAYSHTLYLPIRVCAAQRSRDFEAPDQFRTGYKKLWITALSSV